MQQYVDLGKRILAEGTQRYDRTGVGTLSVFDSHLTFDLRESFPLVTVKETRWKTAFLEMLFFLTGETNVKWLNDFDCKLWDAWADADGNLGPVYGWNWRNWTVTKADECYGIDQVKQAIYQLKTNPASRRMLVTAWNVGELKDMALPPCHWAHQLYSTDGYVDMKLFLRSSDFGLGLPFNIAQYALLLHLYARASGLKARKLIVDIGDAHIYLNHVEKVKMFLERAIIDCKPKLVIDTPNTDIDGYNIDDFGIVGYSHHPHVKLDVAV